jgi:hypothetical protein
MRRRRYPRPATAIRKSQDSFFPFDYPKIAGKHEPDFKLRDIGTIILAGTA